MYGLHAFIDTSTIVAYTCENLSTSKEQHEVWLACMANHSDQERSGVVTSCRNCSQKAMMKKLWSRRISMNKWVLHTNIYTLIKPIEIHERALCDNKTAANEFSVRGI